MSRFRSAGFSLLELMIVVAIIGIIAAAAYPSYKESIARGRRSDAQTAVSGYAAAMERYFVGNNSSYVNADTANLFPTVVPIDGSKPVTYNLTLSNLSATAYTIKAVRNTSGPQKSDKCGDFVINQFGQQTIENATGVTAADCWRK